MSNLLSTILMIVVGAVTPELREALSKSVVEWEAKAAQTKNPFDDILVKIIKAMLGMSS
jgi:hypothetical protein